MELVVESNRSTVVLAVVLLLVGALVGFGVGFGVGNGTKSEAKVAQVTTGTVSKQKTKKPSPAQTQRFNQLVRCLAAHGVTWPKTVGRPQIGTPPPGVPRATYAKAVGVCYGNALKSATTVPAASSN